MKAWLETNVVGLGAGLGKIDIVFIPQPKDKCLTVKVASDGRAWIYGEADGQPRPEDGLREIKIDDALVAAISASLNAKDNKLPHETGDLLVRLVKKSAQ